MAFTARLTDELQADASAYADRLGVSVNALLSVALRDYLDRRIVAPPVIQSTRLLGIQQAEMSVSNSFVLAKKPKSVSDPCPCGFTDTRGYPVKWKHCHGKAA